MVAVTFLYSSWLAEELPRHQSRQTRHQYSQYRPDIDYSQYTNVTVLAIIECNHERHLQTGGAAYPAGPASEKLDTRRSGPPRRPGLLLYQSAGKRQTESLASS